MIFKQTLWRSLPVVAATALVSVNSQAGSLLEAIDRARDSEPTYLSSQAEVSAFRARQEQAEAALYPQITATSNASNNNRKSQTDATMFSSGKTNEYYSAASAQLNFTQPLFRSPSVIAIRQSKRGVSQSEFKLEATEGELYTKVVSAWLDMLAGRDNLTVTQLQILATKRQWDMLHRGAELGTSALPQSDEARMKYEQALAENALAESDQAVKRATLEQLVGQVEEQSWPIIRPDAALTDLNLDRLDAWLEQAQNNNALIRSAQMAYAVAKAEFDKQDAGHLPTFDLVGSYGETIQGAGTSPGQSRFNTVQWSIGLQMNVSVYGGGGQASKIKEAAAQQTKASFDLELARRNAVLSTKQAWFAWQAASAKARAAKQAITSAQSALKLATTGVSKGLKTEFDVLQAQQQDAAGRRDLNKALYDQIAAVVKLKANAGALTRTDLQNIDALFVMNEPVTTP